jgi:hypothetical protein
MLGEESFVQTAIGHIRSKKDSGGTHRVSPMRKSADRAIGA